MCASAGALSDVKVTPHLLTNIDEIPKLQSASRAVYLSSLANAQIVTELFVRPGSIQMVPVRTRFLGTSTTRELALLPSSLIYVGRAVYISQSAVCGRVPITD